MNILLLCDYFKNYRENRASFRIRYLTAQQMCQKGHDVVFIYPESKFKMLWDNVVVQDSDRSMEVIGTPGILPMSMRTGGFALLDCLIKTIFVMTCRADVIHVVNGHRPSNFIPCILGKYIKGCLIVDECWEWLGKGGYAKGRRGLVGKIISLYDSLLEIKLTELFDKIIVITSDLKERFCKKYKIKVLTGGAENKNLYVFGVNDARDKLGLSKDLFIIGLSNLTPGDDGEKCIFFEALNRLCKRYSNLYLVATGTEQAYVEEVETRYGIKGRIIFTGYVELDKYNQYLSACNVFVLPFPDTNINRGRWPNKLGDYLCVQRPVITNSTGDVGRLLRRFKVGLLWLFTLSVVFYKKARQIAEHLIPWQKDDWLFSFVRGLQFFFLYLLISFVTLPQFITPMRIVYVSLVLALLEVAGRVASAKVPEGINSFC